MRGRFRPIELMKVEYTDVSDTHKSLSVEIPPDVVEHEIDRVTRDYARSLKLPGFRPGKIPAKIVRQRFKQQILHDVAHDLIPRAVEDALRERGVEPIDTPDVKDVSIDEGSAADLHRGVRDGAAGRSRPARQHHAAASRRCGRSGGRSIGTIEPAAQRAGAVQPVDDRAAESGDTLVTDMTRGRGCRAEGGDDAAGSRSTLDRAWASKSAPRRIRRDSTMQLLGLTSATRRRFACTFPADYPVADMAGAEVEYAITVTALRRKVLPDARRGVREGSRLRLAGRRCASDVREHLQREAGRNQEREVRQDLLQQLARRVTVDAPESLVAREVDRRLEEFVHRAGRTGSRPEAGAARLGRVRGPTSARRRSRRSSARWCSTRSPGARSLPVEAAEVEAEVERFAAQSGQPVATVAAAAGERGRNQPYLCGVTAGKGH